MKTFVVMFSVPVGHRRKCARWSVEDGRLGTRYLCHFMKSPCYRRTGQRAFSVNMDGNARNAAL